MINSVDEVLRQLLLGEMHGATGDRTPDISFGLPSQAKTTPPDGDCINLYLHDVRENLTQREESLRVSRRPDDPNMAGRKRSPIRLDLSYLLTAHAGDNRTREHQLLSTALGILLRNIVVPSRYLVGDLAGQEPNAIQLSVANVDHPSHSDLSALWQSMGERLRPAIPLVATISYDPFETKWSKVVREALIGIHPGIDEYEQRESIQLHGTKVSIAGVVIASGCDLTLSGATVCATGLDSMTSSDDKGFFYLLDLPPGRCELEFRLRGFHTRKMTVPISASRRSESIEPLVVALEPLTDAEWADLTETDGGTLVQKDRRYEITLSGRLEYANGRPAAYVPVRAGRKRTVTDAAGVYSLSGLAPDESEIVVELSEYGEITLDGSKGGGTQVLPQQTDQQ